jgi:hypothetical protein
MPPMTCTQRTTLQMPHLRRRDRRERERKSDQHTNSKKLTRKERGEGIFLNLKTQKKIIRDFFGTKENIKNQKCGNKFSEISISLRSFVLMLRLHQKNKRKCISNNFYSISKQKNTHFLLLLFPTKTTKVKVFSIDFVLKK